MYQFTQLPFERIWYMVERTDGRQNINEGYRLQSKGWEIAYFRRQSTLLAWFISKIIITTESLIFDFYPQ